MAFNFGSTNTSAFGNANTRPTAFGVPFGSTPATSASTGFGTFGSTFGQPAQSQASSVFGASTFGTSSSTAPAATPFGSSFGTPAASTAPAFGSTFGAAAPAPAFGSTFGTPAASTTPSLFGNTTTTKPSLFGTSTTSTGFFSTPSSTGTGLFGNTTTTQATGLFGSTATAGTPSLFGNTATTTTPSLFGSTFAAPATTTAATGGLFGNTTGSTLGTTGTGISLFGSTATTSAPSLFGGFGTSTTSTGFGNFGTFGQTTTQPSLFGTSNTYGTNIPFGAKPAVAPGAPAVPDAKSQQIASFYAINVFGDERDEILKKWNLLQACWGTGKGYFSAVNPPVPYNNCNPFYRFKAIGYIIIPQTENSDGLVKLVFNKKESDLKNQQDAITNGISGILGNKPNLSVTVRSIKATGDNETEITVFVTEKGVTGVSRKIHATDLSGFFNQPAQKQQLVNSGVVFIGPYMILNKAQLEDYLKYPPAGVDQQMWVAAQADNPQPNKYLPIATNGFEDLKKRLLYQEHETGLHRSFLVKVNEDVGDLKKKHAASMAQITDLKQKFLQLQHRVLRLLVKQEGTRKLGLALQPEEEVLKGRLEMLHSHLNAPAQFRGQINELINNMKLSTQLELTQQDQYKMDVNVQEEIKQFLTMEQNGISHLIKIINTDLEHLKIIHDGMHQYLKK